jgi:hypothetical protein
MIPYCFYNSLNLFRSPQYSRLCYHKLAEAVSCDSVSDDPVAMMRSKIDDRQVQMRISGKADYETNKAINAKNTYDTARAECCSLWRE